MHLLNAVKKALFVLLVTGREPPARLLPAGSRRRGSRARRWLRKTACNVSDPLYPKGKFLKFHWKQSIVRDFHLFCTEWGADLRQHLCLIPPDLGSI